MEENSAASTIPQDSRKYFDKNQIAMKGMTGGIGTPKNLI